MRATVAALVKVSRLNFSTPLTKTSHVMTMVIRGFGAFMRSPDATGSSLKGTGLSLRPWLLAGWLAFVSRIAVKPSVAAPGESPVSHCPGNKLRSTFGERPDSPVPGEGEGGCLLTR